MRLAATILALLMGAQAMAVDIPQDFGKSLHVAEMAGAKGPAIEEGRLLLCEFLFADELGALAKPLPWIVAVHTDPGFNEHMAMERNGVKVEFSTARSSGDVTYWAYLREANDYAYLEVMATILTNAFPVAKEKRAALINRVREKFLLMVDVKQLEKKH